MASRLRAAMALSILVAFALIALAPAAPKTPAAGWCKTNHKPPKAAQSGHRGFCKVCFRKQFPDEAAAKATARKKACVVCGNVQEVVANRMCRPCHRARSCDTCNAVNLDAAAQICEHCSESQQLQGSSQGRLAIWCSACASPDQLAAGLCKMCFDKQSRLDGCHHCRAAVDFSSHMITCAEPGCGVRMRFCRRCAAAFSKTPAMQCKSCWHANGDMCISCQSHAPTQCGQI